MNSASINLLSVIGTRPQYIKVSQIHSACVKQGVNHVYIDSGQHFDPELSSSLIDELNLPNPIWNARIGGLPPTLQVAKLSTSLYDFIKASRSEVSAIFVYGDTNTTAGASLGSRFLGVPVHHIEAGIRSFVISQPEEQNRILADEICDLLFVPTESAMKNLESEGLSHKAILVGDLTLDAVQKWQKKISSTSSVEKVDLSSFFLLTLHRPHNVDNLARLRKILNFIELSRINCLLPLHPRLKLSLEKFKLSLPANIRTVAPMSYNSILDCLLKSRGLITDSGGLQKEAFLLKKITTTIGEFTEWQETLRESWNSLWSPYTGTLDDFLSAISRNVPETHNTAWLGEGNVSEKIITNLIKVLDSRY